LLLVGEEMMKTTDEPVIKITKFVPVTEDIDVIFKCDECNKTFSGLDVELKPFLKGFNIMFEVNLVESTGDIIEAFDTSKLSDDRSYYTMHCPVCHMIHLDGFTVYNKRIFEVL
jgi:hypothetical protein